MDKRQMREMREQEIIGKAIHLLSKQGFLGVRMADIAKATGFSMGTIYSHFESKEDLLVACAHTLSMEHKTLFHAILSLQIPAIEKIITTAQCSWYISLRHPDLVEIDNLSLMPSVWRRATDRRAENLSQLHVELAGVFFDIVMEAINTSLDGHHDMSDAEKQLLAQYLTHGMWGLCVGLSSTAQSGYASTLCSHQDEDSQIHFVTNYKKFLKGYGWQEKDPDAVFKRCQKLAESCIAQTTWFSDVQTDESS